jgi:hypothetical protein
MAAINSYKDLIVWQKGIQLCEEMYLLILLRAIYAVIELSTGTFSTLLMVLELN